MVKMKYLGFAFLISSFVFFFQFNPAQAQVSDYGPWHMMPGMYGGWGMGWVGMLFMLVFWGLVVVALVFLIKWLIQTTRGGKTGNGRSSGALDILKERYARGEIEKAEFETKKRDLMD